MLSFKSPQALLFLLIASVTLGFSISLARSFFNYFPLSKEAKAAIFQWEVLELDGKYPIKASYSFEAQGQTWKNSFIFDKPWSWNEASAIDLVKEKAKKNWTAFYNPNNPSSSLLEKKFPYNLLFRTLVCYVTLFYSFLLYRKFLIFNNY